MLRVGGALVGLAALTAVGVSGGASAQVSSKAGATVIKMEQDGKDLFFSGPATVPAGATLKIKNKTSPAKVGPHTFSLVKPKFLPETPKQIKACGRELKGICGAVVGWHDVDLETGAIGENPVVVGKEGWDQEGTKKRKGDSWVSEQKKQSFKREVTAEPGKSLTFFCAVHPEMQGEITVTE